MIAGLLLMLAAVALLAVGSRRVADRFRLGARRRLWAKRLGAVLLALSFVATMLAGGGLLAFIGWVLAFGLLSPLVTLGFTAHAKRR
jgi:Na+/proline symporter